MKKIWKIMILCMIFCFFCAGCSNDDEMNQDEDTYQNQRQEKRTEIIKQKTTQKKNEVTVDQEQSKQKENRRYNVNQNNLIQSIKKENIIRKNFQRI